MKKLLVRKIGQSERRTAALFLLPALAVILAVNIYPVLNTVYLSFRHEDLLHPDKSGFAGFENYIDVFTSGEFWNSIGITVYFAAVSIIVQITLGVLIALLLNQKFKGRGFVRGIIIIPWAIPTLVNASLWDWILNANYGLLNRLLLQMNIISKPVLWMADAKMALNMLIVADTWHMLPMAVIMLLAALQTIDQSALEASIVDGANSIQRFWYIMLPAMKPLMLVLLIMRTTQTLKVFDIIYMTTHGGPANGTMAISFYAYYEMFKNMNFGRGATLSVVMAVFVMIIAIIYTRILRTDDH